MTEILDPERIANLILPLCHLHILEGPKAGKQASFRQSRVTVGRTLENDFALEDDAVSRLHFHLSHERGRGFRLLDEGSTNGVRVGGLLLKDAYLETPMELRVGNSLIAFTPGEELYEIPYRLNQQMYGGMVVLSEQMAGVCAKVNHLASTEIPLLLLGETGTGKGTLAREVHQHSHRCHGPFIQVNCASIPPELFESEMFGHVKGAFTGATQDRDGVFQRAHGGTLFLDEIGELPLEQQAKLLTVLDRKEVLPLGGKHPIPVDIRLVTATNRQLHQEMQAGRFRSDLYYRIAVVEMEIPPLRVRVEEIYPLAMHFLRQFVETHPHRHPRLVQLSPSAVNALLAYAWPGNVRELSNVMLAGAGMATGQTLELSHLPARLLQPAAPVPAPAEPVSFFPEETLPATGILPFKEEKNMLLEHFERQYVQRLLEIAEHNVSQASRLSGLNRKHIYTLKKKYDL